VSVSPSSVRRILEAVQMLPTVAISRRFTPLRALGDGLGVG
jgi:hypothetical protein